MSNQEKILVTGANGFIGHALVKKLEEHNFEVVTLDHTMGNIAFSEIKFKDINFIFHLAAATFVPASWEHPNKFYETNIMGTVNVLEYARKMQCGITIPSTYMYGNPKYLPIDEKHPLGMDMSPYHQSKGISENIAKFYSEKFGVDCTILRLFNVFGLGQKKSFLIPSLIEQITSKNNNEVEVMNLEPRRDYVYIKDIVSALLLTINHKPGFSVYNVGTGISLSVAEVVDVIMNCFNIRKKIIDKKIVRKNEILNTVADIRLIKKELGWVPAYDFKSGVLDIKKTMGFLRGTDEKS